MPADAGCAGIVLVRTGSTPAAPVRRALGAQSARPGRSGADGSADAPGQRRRASSGWQRRRLRHGREDAASAVVGQLLNKRRPLAGRRTRVGPGALSGGASPSTGGGLMAIVATRYFGVSSSRFGGRTAPAATRRREHFDAIDRDRARTVHIRCRNVEPDVRFVPTRRPTIFAGATGTRCSGAAAVLCGRRRRRTPRPRTTSSRRATDIRGCSATDRCCRRCRRACDRRTPRRS